VIHFRQLIPVSIGLAGALTACGEPLTGPSTAVSADRLTVVAQETETSARHTRVLKCPLARSGSTWEVIDASGGTLSLDGHSVRIAAGTVSTPTRFTLSVSGIRGLTLELAADGSAPAIDQPVELTISYAGCPRQDIGRRTLQVLDVGEGTGSTLAITPVVDAAARTLSLQGSRSVYVVAY
jgi:hypothetical protein